MALRKFAPTPQFVLVTSLLATLSGCTSTPEPIVGRRTPAYDAALGQAPFSQPLVGMATLGPADVISIVVFREPDLSASNVAIDPNGMISLPLIGPIKASDKTADELAKAIQNKLEGEYLVNPRVSVSLITVGSRKVTVEGAVLQPGMYDLPAGTKLSGAIALAQGPSSVAKTRQIAVFRETSEGLYVARFDYLAMQAGTMADPQMQPGDRIIVGTSGAAKAWQDFLRTVPLIGVFQRF